MVHCLLIVSAGDRRDVVHCLQEIGEMWFTVCRRYDVIHCLSIVSAGDRRDVVHCLQQIGEMWFTVCGSQERCGSLFVSLRVQEIGEMWFTVCWR